MKISQSELNTGASRTVSYEKRLSLYRNNNMSSTKERPQQFCIFSSGVASVVDGTADSDQNNSQPQPWKAPPYGILEGPRMIKQLTQESLGVYMLRKFKEHGDRIAFVDGVTGDSCTYSILLKDTVHFARGFHRLIEDIRSSDAGYQQQDHDRQHQTSSRSAPSLRNRSISEKDIGADEGHITDQPDTSSPSEFDPGSRGQGQQSDEFVVGIYVENRKELVSALVANLLVGLPVATMSPPSNPGELIRSWTIVNPRLVFCSWTSFHDILEVSRFIPSLTHVVVFPGEIPDDLKCDPKPWEGKITVIPYDQIQSRTTSDETVDVDFIIGELGIAMDTRTQSAYLQQCSGSNKIANLTHYNMAYTVQLLQERDSGYGWTSDEVILLAVPLCHTFGLGMCLGALALGAQIVTVAVFRVDLFVAVVRSHKVSQVVLVPAEAALLAQSPMLEGVAVRGISGAVCAAAPLSRALNQDLSRRLQIPEGARQAYGITQTSCSLIVAPKGCPLDSQGKVVPGAKAKIVDQTSGKPLMPMQVGELMLQSPSIMAGYYRDQEATKEVLTKDQWLRTGDLAYFDYNGFIYVVERLQDVLTFTKGHLKEFQSSEGEND